MVIFINVNFGFSEIVTLRLFLPVTQSFINFESFHTINF